jgi:NADPH-dependent curcumin reductase CurA
VQKPSQKNSPADIFSINCEVDIAIKFYICRCVLIHISQSLTAYFGLLKVGQASSVDETVVISAARGATGSIVCQIAKRVLGIRTVIGIAGSTEKCDFLEVSCGCDVVLNYKDLALRKICRGRRLSMLTYSFDNVGGPILDLVYKRMAMRGRIVSCGSVSSYNSEATSHKFALSAKAWRLTVRCLLNPMPG